MSALGWLLVASLSQAPVPNSGAYLEASAGAPVAHFLPLDSATEAEHLVTSAGYQSAAGGYGFVWSRLRLDVGLRISRLRLDVRGSYSETRRDDAFTAGYEYIGFLGEASVSSRFGGRVDPTLGVSLGPAAFISDRLGGQTSLQWIRFYGSFSGGVWVHATQWLDVRAGVQWIPPVSNLNVVIPELALRVRL
jgi:hypothetical protein